MRKKDFAQVVKGHKKGKRNVKPSCNLDSSSDVVSCVAHSQQSTYSQMQREGLFSKPMQAQACPSRHPSLKTCFGSNSQKVGRSFH